MKTECEILSYECAYNQLILHINAYYWRLIPITKKQDKPCGLFIPLQLGFYQIKKNGHQYRGQYFGLFGGSSHSHGEALNAFLKNIYATQDSRQEGCMVLFRWIKGALNSPGDCHFLYSLAKVAISLSRNIKSPDYNRAVQLIPLKSKPLVKFEDKQAERINQEIDEICKSAQKYIYKYKGIPDQEDLRRSREFGQAILFGRIRYGI